MKPAEWATTAGDFADYLLYTAGRSKETVRAYVSSLHLFWEWCEAQEECARSADYATVLAWRKYRSTKASPNTIHGNIAALRAFYDSQIDAGVRTDNPASRVKVKRTDAAETEPLSPGELAALFKACTNERDRVIILLLVYSGVRIAEFAGMCAEHIDWLKGTITIYGKGGTVAAVKPAADVLERLRAHVGFFPEGPIWRSHQSGAPMAAHQVRKLIYRIAKTAGISDVHPHRFRSTFACEMLEQTDGDLQAVKGAMRHKDVGTTTRYLKSVERRRALAKMSGLTFGIGAAS